ncbi:MAG: hypothetical protein A4E72_00344 [Syntrophus sp. PtaU1.Bin208]|nr:MAG: hypothetical protein A4E72_00344 [Syntrophus sp. PtaU1.Bin208]
MKIKKYRRLIPFLLAIFLFTACAPLPPPGTPLTPEERASAQRTCIATYTATGVLGGALGGALLGALSGKGEGLLIGAAAGAAVGGALAFAIAWGHCLSAYSDLKSYPVAGGQETASRTGYNSSQGEVIKIENYFLNPTGVSPGGKVQMNGSYYVMAPEGEREVKVTETRALSFLDPEKNEWKELGAVDQEVTSAIGTRRAEGSFDIPADAPEGQYRITLKVSAFGKTDQLTKDLTVKKGLAMGPSASSEGTSSGAKSVTSSSPKKKSGKKK